MAEHPNMYKDEFGPTPLIISEEVKTKIPELTGSETCGLLAFDDAEVRPGFFQDTYVLIVRGTKPYMNMRVELQPRRCYYVRPDYWEIEVVGCMGIGLPATAPYSEELWLQKFFVGKKGIVVVGANGQRKKFDVTFD